MRRNPERPFSWVWVILSMVTFIAVELVVGGLIGPLLKGRYVSIALGFTLQGLLNIGSYLVGGFLIGVLSPGIRIVEPAVGAFLSVGLLQVLTLFTPYFFMGPDAHKLILAGFIALLLAGLGASAGEKLMGNLKTPTP
jgi:hypothetical protein